MKNKLTFRQIFLLALIPLGAEMMWMLYNSYVPLYLQAGGSGFTSTAITKGFALGPFITAVIMTIDNVCNLIISPVIGVLSDQPNKKGQRRIPYLKVIVPVGALGFTAIPFIALLMNSSISYGIILFLFMAAILIVCISWSSVGLLVTALRWDVTPVSERSKVQAFVLIISAIGTVIISLIGSKFFAIYQPLIFIITGAVLIIGIAVVSVFHKEPEVAFDGEKEPAATFKDTAIMLKNLPENYKKEFIFFAISAFGYQLGIAVQQAQLTSYSVFYLGLEEGFAGFLSSGIFLIAVIFALPSSMFAKKVGLKNAIKIGMAMNVVLYIAMFAISQVWMLYVLIFLAGISTTLMIVNMPPLTANVAPSDRFLGTFISMILILNTLGNILGPIISGSVIEFVFSNNYKYMWLISAMFYLLSLVMLNKVKTIERKE
jgi:maltose/moltooligosaccharide transporter